MVNFRGMLGIMRTSLGLLNTVGVCQSYFVRWFVVGTSHESCHGHSNLRVCFHPISNSNVFTYVTTSCAAC